MEGGIVGNYAEIDTALYIRRLEFLWRLCYNLKIMSKNITFQKRKTEFLYSSRRMF